MRGLICAGCYRKPPEGKQQRTCVHLGSSSISAMRVSNLPRRAGSKLLYLSPGCLQSKMHRVRHASQTYYASKRTRPCDGPGVILRGMASLSTLLSGMASLTRLQLWCRLQIVLCSNLLCIPKEPRRTGSLVTGNPQAEEQQPRQCAERSSARGSKWGSLEVVLLLDDALLALAGDVGVVVWHLLSMSYRVIS